jgi:flagellar M-ring protein FliF
MAEYWNALREKITYYWSSWTLNQKVLVSGGALFLLLALITATWALTKSDNLEPLYTKLEANDAAGITAKLKEMKISYELADGGSTILVPITDKYQTRLDLAAMGLPRGNVGFESLEESKFGETTRDKEVRFNLALQGELARTIGHVQGIEQAWVYLTMPEKALFTKEQEARTASVMIKINPGVDLDSDQVKGIMHLVAKGVEGLKPENVTVVDINGRILSEDLTDISPLAAANKLTANQLTIQKQFEKDVSQNIQSMLEKVVGYGNAVVRVRAELDFDQKEIVTEKWGDRVPRSTENAEEISQGQNTSADTVTGEGANTPPGYPTNENQGGSFSQEKTTTIVNNEIDRTEMHQVVAPGAVKRLSVAVVVNGAELPPERLKAIEQAARMAAGIQDLRGDQITVSAVPFDTTYWDRIQTQVDTEAKTAQWQKWGLIGGVLLVLVLIGIVIFMMMRRRRVPTMDVEIGEPIPVEELLDIEEMLSPVDKEKKKIKDQIEKLVREKPDEVAGLLRVWLSEDQR